MLTGIESDGLGWCTLLECPPPGGGGSTGSVVGRWTFGVLDGELLGEPLGTGPPRAGADEERGAPGAPELVRGAGCGPLPAELDLGCPPGAEDFVDPVLLPG